jgi:hypothetical protein
VYRGREQATLLHEGDFNAELLGFYQDGEMKKVGKETYFVSSTSASAKAKDTTHFIGRKIAPVPILLLLLVLAWLPVLMV